MWHDLPFGYLHGVFLEYSLDALILQSFVLMTNSSQYN